VTLSYYYTFHYIDRHASDVMESPRWNNLVSSHPLLVAAAFKALAQTTLPRKRPRLTVADQTSGHSST